MASPTLKPLARQVDPSLVAVSFPYDDQPILAANDGHGGVLREWAERPVETQHVPWLVVLHPTTLFPRPFQGIDGRENPFVRCNQ